MIDVILIGYRFDSVSPVNNDVSTIGMNWSFTAAHKLLASAFRSSDRIACVPKVMKASNLDNFSNSMKWGAKVISPHQLTAMYAGGSSGCVRYRIEANETG